MRPSTNATQKDIDTGRYCSEHDTESAIVLIWPGNNTQLGLPDLANPM